MKIKRAISPFWALALMWVAAHIVEAKVAAPKTVLDYFLLLPARGRFATETPKNQRRAWLREKSSDLKPVVDIKNDYILAPGDGAQGTIQFALFRYKGRVLVVMRDDFEDGTLDFLRYENGRWKDVTKQMMPVPYNVHYDYHVPRWGTTIKVTAGRDYFEDVKPSPNKGKKVYDLVWDKGKFKVKR